MNPEDLEVESIRQFLTPLVEQVVVQAALVVLAGFVAARIVDLVITRVILRLARKTKTTLDDRLVELLHKPLFTTVMLLSLLIALHLVAPNDLAAHYGGVVVQTLVILLWTSFGIRASRLLIIAAADDEDHLRFIQPATRSLFETTATLGIFTVGAYMILIAWGIDPIGWIATAGIAAVALGLAAQDTLGNLFGGIQILADAPYKLGDYIVLETKERGQVTKIGLRSTRLLTEDDIEVTVPNSVIARSKVVNETAGRWAKQRLRVPIGVAYGSDPAQIETALLEAVRSVKGICDDPPPWVQFAAFGDSSLDFVLMCWIPEAAVRGRMLGAINRAIYAALERHGVEIPFPKRDIYIKELPPALMDKLSRTTAATREVSRVL
jgi:MscS family membrane protein